MLFSDPPIRPKILLGAPSSQIGKIGLFRDEDPTHVDKLKFYEFSGSVLGVNRVVDIDRIM